MLAFEKEGYNDDEPISLTAEAGQWTEDIAPNDLTETNGLL
jgi:hypothetical protein